jgi:hypothetical protein
MGDIVQFSPAPAPASETEPDNLHHMALELHRQMVAHHAILAEIDRDIDQIFSLIGEVRPPRRTS